MARPVVISKALAAASANNIATAQSLAGAGNLTLNGTTVTGGVATLDTQRRVLLTSVGNDSGINWTVYGGNDAGIAISETLAGGNAAAVATKQDFLTITRIAASGATAGNVTVGTNTEGSTPWIVPNMHITPFEMAFQYILVSGAANWTIEGTEETPLFQPPLGYQGGYVLIPPVPTPFGLSGLMGLSATGAGNFSEEPLMGWRLTINSGTGTVRVVGVQSGITVN